MNLTARALWLATLVALLGVAGQWLGAPWDGAWRLVAAPLALLLALEALLNRRATLSAEVALPTMAVLGEQVGATLSLRTVQSSLRVRVAPVLPAAAGGRPPPVELQCRPGEPGRVALRLTPARLGEHPWPAVSAAIRGRFGLGWWPRRLPTGAVLRVAPARLPRAATGGVRAGGQRRRSGTGAGAELRDLRDYRPGDPVGAIDWKVTARRGRPVVREYDPDARLSLMVALDAGRTSSLQSGNLTRLGHYVNVTARLAEAAIGGGDRVGLVAYAEQPVVVLSPQSGLAGLARLRRSLQELTAQAADGNALAAAVQIARISRARSLVVLLSDLDAPDQSGQLARAVRLLARRHLPLVATLRDPDLEALRQRRAEHPLDPYESLAALGLAESGQDNLLALSRLGAQVVHAPPPWLDTVLLRRYRMLRRRRAV